MQELAVGEWRVLPRNPYFLGHTTYLPVVDVWGMVVSDGVKDVVDGRSGLGVVIEVLFAPSDQILMAAKSPSDTQLVSARG